MCLDSYKMHLSMDFKNVSEKLNDHSAYVYGLSSNNNCETVKIAIGCL